MNPPENAPAPDQPAQVTKTISPAPQRETPKFRYPKDLCVPALAGSGKNYAIRRVRFVVNDEGQLVSLGEGRTAKVFLGMMTEQGLDLGEDAGASETDAVPIAIKCLNTDPNEEYAQQMRLRFFEERSQTRSRGNKGQREFVRYECMGWVDLEKRGQEEAVERAARERQLNGGPAPTEEKPADKTGDTLYFHKLLERAAQQMEIKPWPSEVLQHVFSMNGEALQGAFYAMEMCQGSLQDLLEGDGDWSAMSCYSGQEGPRDAVEKNQRDEADNLRDFVAEYLEQPLVYWSGYELLNAFKQTEKAEKMRSRVVLELAQSVAEVISKLHRDGGKASPPVAHRDLKPGNLLFQHAWNSGLGEIGYRLTDLGYVVDLASLQSGSASLNHDQWRSHQVPGSLFYRAPEQATLPIEVRMHVTDRDEQKTEFMIMSSKVDNIGPGDYLAFKTRCFLRDDGKLVTIASVSRRPARMKAQEWERTDPEVKAKNSERLRLFVTVDRALAVHTAEDLTAHVVKASGFHTDGFSFGAMLYDLISGGKNPELFYQYCLQNYQIDPAERGKTLTEITDELAKMPSQFLQTAAKLTGLERFKEMEKMYADYLRDGRGVPIPDDILRIVCGCMLRGFEGCYYHATPAVPVSQGKKKTKTDAAVAAAKQTPDAGWVAERNVTAFEKIYLDIKKLYDRYSSELGGVAGLLKSDTLLHLRCLGKASFVQAKANSEVVSPATLSPLNLFM